MGPGFRYFSLARESAINKGKASSIKKTVLRIPLTIAERLNERQCAGDYRSVTRPALEFLSHLRNRAATSHPARDETRSSAACRNSDALASSRRCLARY